MLAQFDASFCLIIDSYDSVIQHAIGHKLPNGSWTEGVMAGYAAGVRTPSLKGGV